MLQLEPLLESRLLKAKHLRELSVSEPAHRESEPVFLLISSQSMRLDLLAQTQRF